jgi:hypothetical protein
MKKITKFLYIELLALNPLRKIRKMKLPPRHEDTKIHKELIFNDLFLVELRAFVPSWQ